MKDKTFKKCVWCKASFVVVRPLQKVCSLECAKLNAEDKKNHEKKVHDKEWRIRKLKMTIEAKPETYKSKLQKSVNLLARMIDAKFELKCIDCGKNFGNQCDGGHFASVGSDPSLRYNLHNIHSQKSDCNQNGLGGGKRLEYRRGLESRYGIEYADYVEFELPNKYKLIKLSNQEVYDCHKIALKVIRQFKHLKFDTPIDGRNLVNSLLGIYN